MIEIRGPRNSGKTTMLIQQASLLQNYIVCRDINESHFVADLATKMNLNIPFPITYDEFLKGEYYGKNIKGFLIDNLDYFLQYIAKETKINGYTISTK